MGTLNWKISEILLIVSKIYENFTLYLIQFQTKLSKMVLQVVFSCLSCISSIQESTKCLGKYFMGLFSILLYPTLSLTKFRTPFCAWHKLIAQFLDTTYI